MNQHDWQQEMAQWLEGYAWQWFASLTFRPGLSEHQRRWRLRQWAKELGEQLGTEDFSWFAVPERGRTGLDPHYHALIGGLREWHAVPRLRWMRRWWKLAGDARVDPYRPKEGGVGYILKGVGPEEFDDVEVHISSRTRMQSSLGG
jgi:hypothetical protein